MQLKFFKRNVQFFRMSDNMSVTSETSISSVKSDSRVQRRVLHERLDFGIDQYNPSPGPGDYEIDLNTFAKPTITIKNRYPMEFHSETKNVSYILPPPEKTNPIKIKSSGKDRKYYEATEGSCKFVVLPSTLSKHAYKFSAAQKTRDEINENPGPGQYDPQENSRKIHTSLAKLRPRQPLWSDVNNDVPGPGKYTITKSYNKPTNWTEYLRFVKPKIPVKELKRSRTSQSRMEKR